MEQNKQNYMGLSKDSNEAFDKIKNEISSKSNSISVDFSQTIFKDIMEFDKNLIMDEDAYNLKSQSLEILKKDFANRIKIQLDPIKKALNDARSPINIVAKSINDVLSLANNRLHVIAVRSQIIEDSIGFKNGVKPNIIITKRILDEIDFELLWKLYESMAIDIITKELKKGNSRPFISGIKYKIDLDPSNFATSIEKTKSKENI